MLFVQAMESLRGERAWMPWRFSALLIVFLKQQYLLMQGLPEVLPRVVSWRLENSPDYSLEPLGQGSYVEHLIVAGLW